jgi:hypothetical protein
LNPEFGIKHEIETGDAKPVAMKPFKLDPVRNAQVNKAMEYLEQIGFAEKGTLIDIHFFVYHALF